MFGLLLGGELLHECITVFNKEQVYRYGGDFELVQSHFKVGFVCS